MCKTKIILIGGGGHCKSVIDTIKREGKYNIVGITDYNNKIGDIIDDVSIITSDDRLEEIYKSGIEYAFITLGSTGNVQGRVKIFNYLKKIGYKIPVIIDPSAIISNNIVLEEGVFVGKGVIINTGAEIGLNAIINSGVVIDHDCLIGKFVHIAPGSTLSGNVIIGSNTHIGTNSTIIQNINIGENTIIGAGSVVVKDIECCVTAFGNPCIVISENL